MGEKKCEQDNFCLPISLALSAATACSWAEQAFAAGGDNGNESFESRFLCNGTTLCYTIDLWRTDIQVLVYIIENGVRHVARVTQTVAHERELRDCQECLERAKSHRVDRV